MREVIRGWCKAGLCRRWRHERRSRYFGWLVQMVEWSIGLGGRVVGHRSVRRTVHEVRWDLRRHRHDFWQPESDGLWWCGSVFATPSGAVFCQASQRHDGYPWCGLGLCLRLEWREMLRVVLKLRRDCAPVVQVQVLTICGPSSVGLQYVRLRSCVE